MAVCFTVMIVLFTLSLLKRSTFETKKASYSAHVAVLDLSGIISSSASFIKDTEALEQNNLCKAVVIRINSPGGVVGPSQEIYDAIKRLDT